MSSSCNNWSQLTIHNVVDTWNGSLKNRRWTAICRTKFLLANRNILHSVSMLIKKKIVVFLFWESSSNSRETITSTKNHCLVLSLVRRCDWISLLRKRRWNSCQRQFGQMITNFFCLLLTNMTWRICGFKKTVPHGTQLKRIWLYCKRQ